MTVTTNATTLSVEAGASVSATSGAAITVAINAPSDVTNRTATISVNGAVDGGAAAGIALTDGTLPSGYYGISTQTDITVGSGGSITGTKGIALGPVAGLNNYSHATLDNAGLISGTSGPAVVADGSYVTFSKITNEASGTIEGFSGAVGTIDNAGVIDGKSGSAIEGTGYAAVYPAGISNSGQIVSNGSAGTIYNAATGITNSGVIANSGTGSAVSGNTAYSVQLANLSGGEITSALGGTLSGIGTVVLNNAGTVTNLGAGTAVNGGTVSISNEAGGTIRASGTAISATSVLYVSNRGAIIGDVFAGTAANSAFLQSTVDSREGTIEGNLVFGAGQDTLYADLDNSGNLITGVTGKIDGGAGVDSVLISFSANRALATAITLPTNFETLALSIDSGVTVTLAQGFTNDGTFSLANGGTLHNDADLTADGTVISRLISSGGNPSLVNTGTITSTGTSGDFALNLGVLDTFTNSGQVISQGSGVTGQAYAFDNAGTISAKGTALAILLIGSTSSNSGTIRSSNDTGLSVGGSFGYAFTNSGTIEGAKVGADISAQLINTGTISSPQIAVSLGSYGLLDNRAGGVITGGTAAVAPSGSPIFNAQIINAGTINGDVSFGNTFTSIYDNNNRYYALAGGQLNGNLTLGHGDYLVTEIDNEGSGAFAGINGTVSASDSYLRYEVRQDTAATLALPEGFVSVGYQLHDNAALTLTANTSYNANLLLSGTGSVDLTADIDVSDTYAILSTGMLSGYGVSGTPNALDITSHGTISATRSDPDDYSMTAVILGSGDSFTNAGTVTARDTTGASYGSVSAISGGSVVNTGTISADGGVAVSDAVTLDNSGTITATGSAVYAYSTSQITNSGSISSSGAAAIQLNSGYGSSIVNLAGGTISGGDGVAIQSSGGTVRNAGTIIGDVDLGWSTYGYSATGSLYYADGGTIEGNLHFGSGDAILIETGSGYGVSGTIDGGNGINTLGHARSASGTVVLGEALPTGFDNEFTASLGSDTVVTITSANTLTSDILVAGDGQIINQAATSGQVRSPYVDYTGLPEGFDGQLASFSNEANVGSGIYLTTGSLSNNAQVGSDSLAYAAIYQSATGTLDFSNSGTIATSDTSEIATFSGTDLTSASIANSGTMRGGSLTFAYGLDASAGEPKLAFTNSGTIETTSGVAFHSLSGDAEPASYTLTVGNSGKITSSGDASSAMQFSGYDTAAIAITDSGTIQNDGAGYLGYFFTYKDIPVPPYYEFVMEPATATASAISVQGNGTGQSTTRIENSGTIAATGAYSTAVQVGGELHLVNTGTITGTQGFTVTADDVAAGTYGTTRFAGAIQTFGDQADSVVNSGTITGSIDLGGGNDSIVNTGTIRGNVWLGAGDDSFTQGISAIYEGIADGGDGNNTLSFDITGGGTLSAASFQPFVNFETFQLTGSGTLNVDGVLPVQTLNLATGSSFDLAAGSTLQTQGSTALTGSEGAETVSNHGTIIGDVVLGGGDDTFVSYIGSSVTGRVDGGSGNDRLAFHLAGATDERVPLDLAPYENFEQLAIEDGTGEYTGNVTFDTVSVDGGRLIGAAGSTLAASGGILVAQGATFGSAGTIIGDVNVAGTLSPGASPGRMVIQGNLSLASGSNTYFEMTSGQSDAIVVSGATHIAAGSTLTITGDRPYVAGSKDYTLISSDGGISGSFSSIIKSADVFGFVRQEGDEIVLTNTMLAPDGASPQLVATVGRLNALLADGTGTDAFYASVTSVADVEGHASTAALSTLHPEPYASASQIGVDNGLTLISTVRTGLEAQTAGQHLFVLGQGLGAWNKLQGRSGIGTANTSDSLGGFLAGAGYRFGDFTAAAFAGRTYAHQTISTLGARTRANGTFVGGALAYTNAALSLGGMLIWDDSSATTDRTLFNAEKVHGQYDLHSLTLDGHAGYAFGLNSRGWTLGPQVELTHIRTDRGATQEQGSDAFALNVSGRTQQVTFVTADLRLGLSAASRLRPNLALGLQQRIGGNRVEASAAFTGSEGTFTVAGTSREKTFAHVGGGLDWAAAPGLSLFAQGQVSFNGRTNAETVNAGLRFAF